MNAPSTAVAIAETTTIAPVRRPAEVRVVSDPIAVLDTARFEHMQRIATVMAHSNLIPHSLCFEKGDNDQLVALPMETVTANCFLIVNQSVRWNMDPFAVAQCVSVVHGKLCYEGKLIAAVIQGRANVDLEYEISGTGDAMKIIVSGSIGGKPVLDSKGRPKTIEGTVGEWKTDGRGSPWSARGGYQRMLRYRGAREWCRVFEPGLMLGVYGDDELEDLRSARAAQVDDGGGPPAPANDDGGGPPVPNQTATATEPEDGGGPPVPVQAVGLSDAPTGQQTTVTIVDDFPGDKPMPKAADDDLGIPDYLDRTKELKSAKKDDMKDWLEEIEAEFAAARTMEELSETHRSVMAPWESNIPTETWNQACDIMDRHVARLQDAE